MDAVSKPKRYRRDPLAHNPFAVQGNNNDGNGDNNSGNNNNGDNKDNNHEFIQRNYSTHIPTKIRFHVVTNLTKKRGNFLNNANNVLINGDCNVTGVANNKTIHLANTGIGLGVNNATGIGLGAVLLPATTATNKNKNIFYGEPNGTLHYPCTGSPTSTATTSLTTPRLNNGFDLFDAPTRCAFDTQRVGFDLFIYSLQWNFKNHYHKNQL